jgi:hypothetical protein
MVTLGTVADPAAPASRQSVVVPPFSVEWERQAEVVSRTPGLASRFRGDGSVLPTAGT